MMPDTPARVASMRIRATGPLRSKAVLRASEAGSAHADRWRGMSRSLTTLNQDSTLIVVIEMIELACRKDGA
jgi:hypothetical protein